MVYLDLQKAFNNVDDLVLLHKFSTIRFGIKSVNWLNLYQTGTLQLVGLMVSVYYNWQGYTRLLILDTFIFDICAIFGRHCKMYILLLFADDSDYSILFKALLIQVTNIRYSSCQIYANIPNVMVKFECHGGKYDI